MSTTALVHLIALQNVRCLMQITNSAVHAKWAVVFAQLHMGGKNEGIHGFLVRIRNEVHSPVSKVLPSLVYT